jgi:hypothetical protein
VGSERLVQFLGKDNFKCEMCGKERYVNKYRRRATQFISNYKPPMLIICRDCCYKEEFGTKNYRKRMKEGVFDDGQIH